MNLADIAFEGAHVKLAPMGLHHVDALLAVGLDPRIWEFTTSVVRDVSEMRKYVETALSLRSAGTAVPFVTMERSSGKVVGSTRFGNIDWDNRKAEIGWTWLNPAWWRTAINTEAKYLMLTFAFEQWKFIRVELKTAAKNLRSRAAIARIGGKEEGTLRRHMINHDGSYRDSVYFSILDDEWPVAKRQLESRLAK